MDAGDGIVYCSLEILLKQRAQAKRLQRGRKNVHARQTGNQPSVYKGRGMTFAESRPYQAGDDVRLLDWRVTARTGKAYTKLFEEEKEQPVMVWIDLRPPMFFATRGCYKSVMAAMLASLLLWKSWLEGNRVGALIVDATGVIQTFKPSCRLSALSRLLQALATVTQQQRDNNKHKQQNTSLIDALTAVNGSIERGSQLILVSDFRGLHTAVEHHLRVLQRYSSIKLLAISDPFEHQLPTEGQLPMQHQGRALNLHLTDQAALQPYYTVVRKRQQQLLQLAQQLKVPLVEISTDDKPVEQLLNVVRGFR